mgnify:CR=1 FL=1
MFRSIATASTLLIVGFADSPPAVAQQAADAEKKTENTAELNEQEQAFADDMAGCVLVGTFSVDGKDDAAPKSERYEIKGATKVEGENWLIHARIVFGDIDAVVPVPVQMHWAGDTPVLSVNDLELPLVGSEFSARVLFDGDRYAGTWGHGKVGGHMWGMIEKSDAAKKQ